MSAMLWRIIIAVICVIIVYTLIPPFSRIIGFGVSSDVMTILKVCIAGLAVLYVIKGPPPLSIP